VEDFPHRPETTGTRGRAICGAKRIWSHYFLPEVGDAFQALPYGPKNGRVSPCTHILMRPYTLPEQITLPHSVSRSSIYLGCFVRLP
jgi:hypothetical protein